MLRDRDFNPADSIHWSVRHAGSALPSALSRALQSGSSERPSEGQLL